MRIGPVERYAHVHLLDFLQNGEFLNADGKFPGGPYDRQAETGRFVSFPYSERDRRIESSLESMDNAKVEHALVSSMPFLKNWSQNEPFMRPRYYLDSPSRVKPARDSDVSVGSAIADYRLKYAANPAKLRRIHSSLCGFDTTDLGAVDLLIKRIKEFPGVWEARQRNDIVARRPHKPHRRRTTPRQPSRIGARLSICRRIPPAGQHSSQHRPPSLGTAPKSNRPIPNEFVQLIEYCRAGNGDCRQSSSGAIRASASALL